MSRPACPAWCLPTLHGTGAGVHQSAPLVVTTPTVRFVLHIEAQDDFPPFLNVAQFSEPLDETDTPSFEPDNLLVLRLPLAADLASAIASLIARALGGAQ
ncbi:hypothetical protein [Verrucosispora sp. NA02020]|uniref:hypothetical protein n=1 Tax=Verrucosispora sp. NA02020 TaxID=2742132 RepID=UPI003D727854